MRIFLENRRRRRRGAERAFDYRRDREKSLIAETWGGQRYAHRVAAFVSETR
jgi:hypothetical protein